MKNFIKPFLVSTLFLIIASKTVAQVVPFSETFKAKFVRTFKKDVLTFHWGPLRNSGFPESGTFSPHNGEVQDRAMYMMKAWAQQFFDSKTFVDPELRGPNGYYVATDPLSSYRWSGYESWFLITTSLKAGTRYLDFTGGDPLSSAQIEELRARGCVLSNKDRKPVTADTLLTNKSSQCLQALRDMAMQFQAPVLSYVFFAYGPEDCKARNQNPNGFIVVDAQSLQADTTLVFTPNISSDEPHEVYQIRKLIRSYMNETKSAVGFRCMKMQSDPIQNGMCLEFKSYYSGAKLPWDKIEKMDRSEAKQWRLATIFGCDG